MLLNRFRVAQLIALSAAERDLAGPERVVRESDVAVLIKAAYDEASEAAREAFMARVKPMPVTAWPWSAVQVARPRTEANTGPGAKFKLTTAPDPAAPGPVPALMILLRGQVSSADKSPGNEIPTRGTPESLLWEPLYRALDAWDTATITQWIGPQGWMSATASQQQQVDPGSSSLPANTGELPVPAWRSKPVLIGAAIVASSALTLMTVVSLAKTTSATQRLEAQLRAVRERD